MSLQVEGDLSIKQEGGKLSDNRYHSYDCLIKYTQNKELILTDRYRNITLNISFRLYHTPSHFV